MLAAPSVARQLPPPSAKGACGGFLVPSPLSGPFALHLRGTLLVQPQGEDPAAAGGQLGLSVTGWDRFEAGVSGGGLVGAAGRTFGPIEGFVRAGPFYPGPGRAGFLLAGFAELAAAPPPFDAAGTLYPSTLTAGPIFGWHDPESRIEAHASAAYQLGNDPAAPRRHGAQLGGALWVRIWGALQLGGEVLARTGCAARDCAATAYVSFGMRLIDEHGVGAGAAGTLGWGAGARPWQAAVRAAWSVGPHYRPSPHDADIPPLHLQEWIDASWARRSARPRPPAAPPVGLLPRPGSAPPAGAAAGHRGGVPPRCALPATLLWARTCVAGWSGEDLAPDLVKTWPAAPPDASPPTPTGPSPGPAAAPPSPAPGVAQGVPGRVPPRPPPPRAGGRRTYPEQLDLPVPPRPETIRAEGTPPPPPPRLPPSAPEAPVYDIAPGPPGSWAPIFTPRPAAGGVAEHAPPPAPRPAPAGGVAEHAPPVLRPAPPAPVAAPAPPAAPVRAGPAYVRPPHATNRAQKAAVQGKPCATCGEAAPKMVADHKTPLVMEHYQTGAVNRDRMHSVDAVQPQCPTCSARQGAEMSRYSREVRQGKRSP